MTDSNAERQANVALATRIMNDFGRNMDGWYDHLHDDIVMEFPFGASVGMPTRVEGKAAASALFGAVVAGVQVQFRDIVIHPMLDPGHFTVEYRGYSEPNGKVYDQTYISLLEFRDGKMSLFKEYWNAMVVDRTFGDLSALASL